MPGPLEIFNNYRKQRPIRPSVLRRLEAIPNIAKVSQDEARIFLKSYRDYFDIDDYTFYDHSSFWGSVDSISLDEASRRSSVSTPKKPSTFIRLSNISQIDDHLLRFCCLYFDNPIFLVSELNFAISEFEHDENTTISDKRDLSTLLYINRKLKKMLGSYYIPALPASTSLSKGATVGESARMHDVDVSLPTEFREISERRSIVNCSVRGPENWAVIRKLTLPILKGVKPATVAKIRSKQRASAIKFEQFLFRRSLEFSHVNSDQEVRAFLAEVDDEVARLHIEVEKLRSLKALQYASIGTFSISIAVLLTPQEYARLEVPAVVGGASFFGAVKSYIDYRNEEIELKANDYFIPFLIDKGRES